jgi:FkbM family methyltransferase
MKLRLHLARLRLLRWGITATPLREGEYDTDIQGAPIRLSHSGFNTKWLSQLNIEPKVVLELGSFDGGDALRFARAFPNARIVTVEADPVRVEVVIKNLAHTHAEVVNNAVCLKDGPIDWYTSKIDGKVDGQGSLYQHSDEYKEKFPHIEQTTESVTVDGLRFDRLCELNNIDEIDFMHMDIEGAEFDALSSMGNIRPKLIFMEMLPNYFEKVEVGKAIEKLLASFGYTLVARLSQDRLYIHKP